MRAPLRREQRQRAEVIRASGEHLLHVINEILDFSKLESGRVELERAPFDLPACLASAVELVRAGADARDVEVRIEVAAAVPQWASGDVSRLRQVLLNLLANAVRSAVGEVTLACAAHELEGGWELAVRVSDDGPGIDAGEQERLFDAFTQGHEAKAGGTGLGLSIAKRLVAAMGGAIGVSSTPGAGATFHFTARVGVAAAAQARHDTVAETATGIEAIRVLDGLATARELRRRLGGACPWLVAMTADVLEEARSEAREAGMDDFVAKPATSDDLAGALRRCARREQAAPAHPIA